jgi:hypothetical protein
MLNCKVASTSRIQSALNFFVNAVVSYACPFHVLQLFTEQKLCDKWLHFCVQVIKGKGESNLVDPLDRTSLYH